jgi:hypothetical protein
MASSSNQVGVFPQFIAQQTEQLVLKEKVLSLSGDSFDIKTVDGRPILQVKGEALSLSGRKRVMDMQGVPLFDIRKKLVALHATFYCEDPNGQQFFEVKKKFSSKLDHWRQPLFHHAVNSTARILILNSVGSTKAIGTFKSTVSGGQDREFVMKGNFFGTSADIMDSGSGQPVASINRKFFNASELIGGQHLRSHC